MITTAGVPVAITPEAAEYAIQLGLQAALEQMLDFSVTNFPGVRSIHVTLDPPNETDPDPHLMIHPILPERGDDDLAAWNRWAHWAVNMFPGTVLRYVTLWQSYESENGR